MTTHIPKAWRGVQTHRFKKNPLEARFAKEWHRLNSTDDPSQSTLAYMLCDGDQHHTKPPTDEQRKVASTVVQWLGSPVGARWVLDVLALDPMHELGTIGLDLERAQQVVGPGPVFTSAEIEFMEMAAGMETDPKDERILRRILKKMKANG